MLEFFARDLNRTNQSFGNLDRSCKGKELLIELKNLASPYYATDIVMSKTAAMKYKSLNGLHGVINDRNYEA